MHGKRPAEHGRVFFDAKMDKFVKYSIDRASNSSPVTLTFGAAG
jgi:hypothetical protein